MLWSKFTVADLNRVFDDEAQALQVHSTLRAQLNNLGTQIGNQSLHQIGDEVWNESVFGLIDWDGKNSPTPRIHVLCHGIRDGLETALLDPLLIVAALARASAESARTIGLLNANETYQSLPNWDHLRWQVAVDKLQVIVLDGHQASGEPLTPIRYLSGLSINIRQSYLWMDDHKLETTVKSKFGLLNAHARRRGDLGKHILGTVLTDFEQFMPMDVLDTINQLLTCDLSVQQDTLKVRTPVQPPLQVTDDALK